MENLENSKFVLAGDIGGTQTRVGLFQWGKHRPVLKIMETFPSKNSSSLEDIIDQFMSTHRAPITHACFGIAGPVMNGHSNTTNLPWKISEDRIKNRFDWRHVYLINDLTATAIAVSFLNSREVLSLNRARRRDEQNIGLIAPGTGLGQALLVMKDRAYIPVASEGGHVDFAPNHKLEALLWKHLHDRFGHVSLERVISGPGLYNIYTWLTSSGRYREPPWFAQKIKNQDPAKIISEAAIKGKDPLCVEALNMFVSILGAAAGNLALTGMTTGGIYLGGGIPPKILPFLKKAHFIKAFQNKGRFRELLKNISVKVIINDRAALMGAAWYAFNHRE